MFFNRIRLFLFICLFLGCVATYLLSKREPNKEAFSTIFAKIPKEDRLILEDFFQDLICRTHCGYVLFGNKPVSDFHYINPSSHLYIFFKIDPENLKTLKGIECWRKYYKLFPSKDYFFKFFGDPSKDDYIEVTLINKKIFTETVRKKITKFKTVFGHNITAEKLLVKLSNESDFWDNHFDYEMLGILYGYGESNSYLFQRREDIRPDPCCGGGRFTLKKRSNTPSSGYTTIEEEYTDLSDKLQPLQDDQHLDRGYMDLPGFLAFLDAEETIRIRNDFIQTRKQMIKIFKDGDFFKKSMQRYMGLDPES